MVKFEEMYPQHYLQKWRIFMSGRYL